MYKLGVYIIPYLVHKVEAKVKGEFLHSTTGCAKSTTISKGWMFRWCNTLYIN